MSRIKLPKDDTISIPCIIQRVVLEPFENWYSPELSSDIYVSNIQYLLKIKSIRKKSSLEWINRRQPPDRGRRYRPLIN